MSKDLEAVNQFIKQLNTDYAYMLTGAWGSGKTHFWKHIVLPQLPQGSTEAEDLIAYVSLYGMERPEEIQSAVFAQMHPRLHKAGKYAALLGPALSGLVGISSPEPEKVADALSGLLERLNKGKRLIICFDDLERVSMPIEVALGKINQFVEHAGAKVVILCNEDEIPSASRDIYKKTKEKVVRVTRTYVANPAAALPAIIAEFESDVDYHEFLKQNRNRIDDLLARSGLRNLRVLKYGLLVLQVAFKELSQLLPNEHATLRRYLEVLLPVTFDLQGGSITADDARSFLSNGSSAILGAYMGKKDEKPKALVGFGERYGFGGLENNHPKSPALAQLIETGYLDSAKLRLEIAERNAFQTPTRQATEALLGRWVALPDESIGETIILALNAVRNGEITSPERLHTLAITLGWLASEGVAGITDGAAKKAFEEGISTLSKNWENEAGEIMLLQSHPLGQERENAFGTFVRDLIIKTDAEARDNNLKREFQAAFDAVAADPNRLSCFLWYDQGKGIGERPIAPFVAANALADALISGSNDVRFLVGAGIRRRYLEDYKVHALASDLQWLKTFRDLIARRLADATIAAPIGTMRLRDIHGYAESAILKIQKFTSETVNPSPSNKNAT